ncbi:phosphatidylinositol 3-kinase [Lophium mytilinum]|uniref:Phosphatidylinositol 3-kinase VPS34 n=1 Tax=Lophium mytilinum TaxID=390894 RepID=A0A6A6R067_9PEZI|nr:phosphatidylinositol 3-kinase [Lophium mytilinum]
METFSFATSSSIKLKVNVKIHQLDGNQKPLPYSVLLKRPDLRHRASIANPNSELYATAQIWADSKPLTLPMQTTYKTFKSGRIWNEWLELPIGYDDLPLASQIAITIWDLSPTGGEGAKGHAIPFGGTTIPLFDEDHTLLKGRQRCRLHRHKAADGLSSTTTPWIKRPSRRGRKDVKTSVDVVDEKVAEMERLEALLKKQEMNELPTNHWLDQMVYRKMTKLRKDVLKIPPTTQKFKESLDQPGEPVDDNQDEERFYLHIELPRFDHPIVFADEEYPPPPVSNLQSSIMSEVRLKPPPEVSFGPGINVDGNGYGDAHAGRLVRIYDPEIGLKENPVEVKHRRLVRGRNAGLADRDMKPNARIRDELNAIMNYGPTHSLTLSERDHLWTFRYYLCRDKRALTKFVKSVSWHEQREAQNAAPMLAKWAEIDVDDALELLGPSFTSPIVRAYAVDRLRKADNDELLVYLLQLVQALKYETVAPEMADSDPAQSSSLARFLISRAKDSLVLGNFLHWYLMVECDDNSPEQGPEFRKLFAKVEFDFLVELEKTEEGAARRKTFRRQAELITVLSKISKDARFSREDRTRKIERLKRYLADPKNELLNIDPPLPLPLDPSILITGIDPNDCNVLKSSLFPLQLNFRTTTNTKYPIIFKTGDDLRQDQLVVQIITLMDRLLRKENLDLKLSPYRILATSTSAGAVQFVPSLSLAAAIAKHRGILPYLRANNPDDTAPLGVRKEAMDTYIKSCAGYCVITYLLGVGDRHLDNLLLSPSGHFFHVDFGYILGRDPKPFAPLMKLSHEMIDGMGGTSHPHYAQFKSYCFTAYSTLRKQANLILNLFALMREANIPDIRLEPDKAVWKVQERLALELSEEEAMRYFERLIEESSSAIMPVVIDRLHGLVQHFRA